MENVQYTVNAQYTSVRDLRLHSAAITDITGDTIYGVEPPTRTVISDKFNDLIERLEQGKYKSGYLISKFGKSIL